jgi:hypothetical protein
MDAASLQFPEVAIFPDRDPVASHGQIGSSLSVGAAPSSRPLRGIFKTQYCLLQAISGPLTDVSKNSVVACIRLVEEAGQAILTCTSAQEVAWHTPASPRDESELPGRHRQNEQSEIARMYVLC